MSEPDFLREAIRLAQHGVESEAGGPFGAVVVRQGEILAGGWNCVTSQNDPTAHAEVVAIRAACRKLGTFSLAGCELYASCEPCPMCLAASYWARLDRLVFAATRQDAAAAGFDDAMIYQELELPLAQRRVPTIHEMHADASAPFAAWRRKQDRVPY